MDELHFEWEERPTCWLSQNAQCSLEWHKLHLGRITGSKISSVCGRSPFASAPQEMADQICGISEKSFTPESKSLMEHGVTFEPVIRDWYCSQKNLKVQEVGVAIWKKDPRFGASPDGEVTFEPDNPDPQILLEIKAPKKKLYWGLVQHVEAVKKGVKFPENYHSHIFDSHYDQMMMTGVILNKKFCDYVVVSTEANQAYTQRIPIDYQHWETILYPRACQFYESFVEPTLKKHQLSRIDP